MAIQDSTLRRISDASALLLPQYQALSGNTLRFGGFPTLQNTPTKNYSARSDVPFFFSDGSNELSGELVVLALKPGEGTGTDETFKPESLEETSSYRGAVSNTAMIPRDKSNVTLEAYFPLLTLQGENIHPYLLSLERTMLAIGTQDKEGMVCQGGMLGFKQPDFLKMLYDGLRTTPQVGLTTFKYGPDPEERAGDPHAIYFQHDPFYPSHVDAKIPSDVIQVLGLITLQNDKPNPRLEQLLYQMAGKELYRAKR